MAQNAAIALRVARYLGADAQAVRERLAAWRPAALRGEVRMDGGRLFYLDYYNANPVSMRDALKAFDRLAGRAAPRLFVIGCMEELGAQADAFHAELGGQLPLQPDDRVLLVGDFAAAVRRGAGSRSGQVTPIASAAEAAATVAEFAGPVFIKGSRKHKLEQALTVPAVPLPC
jgi:UDP-N-acetylmuramoyl-tripeptide--D-alanyl-D-alanine ligase